MKTLNPKRLKEILKGFSKIKVLVVGDLILDEFIWGSVSRISPEAPIPVVWEKSKSFIPGGACNVASNVRSLGGRAEVAGIIGNEGLGRLLIDLLKERSIGVSGIWKDAARPTTLKTRVVAHNQQVVRIDREKIMPLAPSMHKKILKYVTQRIKSVDAICIEDYGKGVITPELVKAIVREAKSHQRVITVDPKEDHLMYYQGVTALTPNHHEAAALSKVNIVDDASLIKAGTKMLKTLRCQNVLITRGENGMSVFQKGKKPVKIPTLAQDVFDVSGAGDTVIATYTLALAYGASPLEAAHIANCAAGIVVGKVGTALVTRKELMERMTQLVGT